MMYDVYKPKLQELRVMRILETTTLEELRAFLSLSQQYAPNHDNFWLNVESKYGHSFHKYVDEPITTSSEKSQTIVKITQHIYDEDCVESCVITGNVGDYLVFLDDGRCRIFTEEELKKDYDYYVSKPLS